MSKLNFSSSYKNRPINNIVSISANKLFLIAAIKCSHCVCKYS